MLRGTIYPAMDHGLLTAMITAAAGMFGAGLAIAPKLVLAVTRALEARDAAKARRLAKELKDLRGELAEAVTLCHFDPHTGGMFDLFTALFEAAGIPAVGGIVCSDGRYVRTWRYQSVLGHTETAGLPWQDPRFVAPEDLTNSLRVAAAGLESSNRGATIVMLTSEGVRRRGRVWSTEVVYSGHAGYRVFVVLFERSGPGAGEA